MVAPSDTPADVTKGINTGSVRAISWFDPAIRGGKAPFPSTPRASLDATRINEISHADGARAAANPREMQEKLRRGKGIHVGGSFANKGIQQTGQGRPMAMLAP
ncbi:unnamed protein product [Pleuronectes platessa]|uniref:Uncharacterized protein n=1 Tax=Pleuronectes platessa TaxID=8262 RepID=A0A9N7Y8M2_PLEPL|nr:unnamed protein product [Pleuronectes platessa]